MAGEGKQPSRGGACMGPASTLRVIDVVREHMGDAAVTSQQIADEARVRIPGCTATARSVASDLTRLRKRHGEDKVPKRAHSGGGRVDSSTWPDWELPSDDDMRTLARVLARHARFLTPEVVAAVVEDNTYRQNEWKALLNEGEVSPDIYLWDRSPCAFPGVRRHAGKKEIALFRSVPAPTAPHCLALDDNDYPKHIWTFVFTGKRFGKRGPNEYQLAHLADHKEFNNRWGIEFGLEGSEVPHRPFGLFTSVANTIFVPAGFLRPTDFSPELRSLLLHRAYRLYGSVCRLLPPPFIEKPLADGEWDPDDFDWAPPVGTTEHVPAFLEFRRRRINEITERSK